MSSQVWSVCTLYMGLRLLGSCNWQVTRPDSRVSLECNPEIPVAP